MNFRDFKTGDEHPAKLKMAVSGIIAHKHVKLEMLLWVYALVALAFFNSQLSAVESSTNAVARYNFRTWQTDEGLPQNTVHAIAQTEDGYLWVGTREGLARFDGVRFTVIEDRSAPQLKQAWITSLYATRDGSLWIGSGSNDLTRLRDGVFTRFSENENLPRGQIQCARETRDGSLWVGSETGLTCFKDGRFTRFTGTDMLINNSVKDIFEDQQGIIRIATVTGLISIGPDGHADINNFGVGVLTNVILKSVCADQQGRLWLGATDGLLSLTDGKRGSYAANKTLPEKITTALHEDRFGQLWIGTYEGLVRRVDGRLVPWAAGKTAFSDLVYTIFEDREENLWVGGRDGLYRLTPARFDTFTMQDGLNCNNVMSVCEDQSGAMWFGTWGGGVNKLKDGQFSAITSTNGLTFDTVLSLHQGRDGNLWVGMDRVGVLNRLREGGANDFPRISGMINAAIRVIHEDADGPLWVGTSKGLNVIRDGHIETYTDTNGLPGSTIMAICSRASGGKWIGTDGGLSLWQSNRFQNFTTRNGLSHDGVNALYEDRENTLWIGTRAGGLNRFRDGKFTAYTTRQGLFSDEIYEILEDDFGSFWMSCRRGIFRVSRRELDLLDRGEIKSINSAAFGKADGLASVQCNGVAKPAGWKARDGRLWFPTIRGVVAMESRIRFNAQPPTVLIEEIMTGRTVLRTNSLNNRGGQSVIVPPGRGELEIHFTATSFQSPEKVRFRYKLEGVDAGWQDAPQQQRSVIYNSVGPGRYRFYVTACNNDGIWSETPTVLAVEFEPHIWQSRWFKVAIVAAAAGLLVLFYRWRVAQLRQIENLRIRIASDLHDDVGSRLTKVAMVTEQMDRDTPSSDRAKPHIENIAHTTREVISAMDEIVWTINPRNDTLDNLANYIFHYAQEYFQNTDVRCRLDLPAALPDEPISTEQRHNLFMAVKEALNNVLKHAAATEARVRLAAENSLLTIVITDNGRGFVPAEKSAPSNGLLNMRERLARIGGRLLIETRAGQGTVITMEMPIR